MWRPPWPCRAPRSTPFMQGISEHDAVTCKYLSISLHTSRLPFSIRYLEHGEMVERWWRDISRPHASRALRPQVTRHTGHTHQVTRSTLVCVTRPTAHAGARLTRAQLTRGTGHISHAPTARGPPGHTGHGSRWARWVTRRQVTRV